MNPFDGREDESGNADEFDPEEGRAYVHGRCGGVTEVSGSDFTHICDPFWPCTSTYCCECAGFAPLREVRWTNTGETVLDYRRRLRRGTPGLVQAWRYGVGFAAGAALGAGLGWLAALLFAGNRGAFMFYAALGGALVVYVVGIFLLHRIFGIDYRRMR